MSRSFVCVLLPPAVVDGRGNAVDVTPLIIRQAISAGPTPPPPALRVRDGADTDPLPGPLRVVGVMLESRKAPLSVVVVDAISKAPTEN